MGDYDELLRALDLPAKVRLLTGASFAALHGDPAIGLAPMTFSDGPTGVKGQSMSGGPLACLLPNATALAGTWSEELLLAAGELLAGEAVRQGVHVVLGPTINLHRSPLAGRVFESFSEDPLLTGKLAAAYIKGVQKRGVGTSLKHFVANDAETERQTVDNRVDEATLREVYLLPFEIAIEDADPWTLMAAYNAINGVTATEHDALLNGVVKGELGYHGLIMSDWFATRSVAAAAGGLDLVMPGPYGPWGQALVDAVAEGAVAEEAIDDHVRRLLRLADRVGALGSPRAHPEDPPAPDDPQRRAQLRDMAAAGMTVLTNDGVLPLGSENRIALIGVPATDTVLLGGGSSMVTAPHQVSIADGLTAVLGDRVRFAGGVEVRTTPAPARAGFVTDPVDGRPGIRVRLMTGDGDELTDDHMADAQRIIGFDSGLAGPVGRVRLSARLDHKGPVQLGVLGLGSWVLTAGALHEEFVVEPLTGIPGEAILAPRPHTLIVDLDGPVVVEAELDLGRTEHALVGLIARPAPKTDEEAIADAVRAARGADLAVVVVGLTDEQETESRDKTTLALPGAQDALVEAVAAVAPRTVVVVNSATPVLLPWADRVDAILAVGLPGQEGGHAVAAALLGDLEPAGRLVSSWPIADGAGPAWSVTPEAGVLEYAEGPFVGYRGHAAGRAPAPRYWFGHGLGYGRWEYADARADLAGPAPRVTVAVRNLATHTSREVVQVYFQPADAGQPVRLVGWAGAEVGPGATADVTVECDARLWRRWDTSAHRWADLDLAGELLIARGLGDIRLRAAVEPNGNLHRA
ncbi:beta-glucosidase family protein [Paractinoplanes durhamensis]|uniref:beta-glucosidase family protein n=1 Tax=Paractinoplanes durhamensis TaxID=113563 RepID=UPI001EF1868F|nr:glycoside hydrolase family 3 C-terminal domain-containing protein [Actinoplanes durhamensis]